jgi:exopolysaccharide production protein ExoQ
MSSTVAMLVTALGIAGLFYLDRDRSIRISKALWLPVMWVSIVGSRSVSEWLGYRAPDATTVVDGSPLDRAVFQALLFAGIIVLVCRSRRTMKLLSVSWPIVLFFSYCLLSVTWSDFPAIAFKRWVKAIGDLVMVLVIVTDVCPLAAMERLICRLGFILLPTSVLLIRYFGELGRGYDPDGLPMNTGVTNNKNTLGVITLVIAVGALWRFLNFLHNKTQPDRLRHLFANGVLTAFGVAVLALANSATSIACFVLGSVILILTGRRAFRRRPNRIHALMFTIVLAAGLAFLVGAQASVIHGLGRSTNLTGRSEIWAAVLPVVPNPVIGAGFESFWLGPRLNEVWSRLSAYMHVNEAHNGYLEVYLNLGWIGTFFIAVILINSYQSSVAAFRRHAAFGSLMLAYVGAAGIYGISEAGFRMLNPMWIFLLLALVGARGIAAGIAVKSHASPAAFPVVATTCPAHEAPLSSVPAVADL